MFLLSHHKGKRERPGEEKYAENLKVPLSKSLVFTMPTMRGIRDAGEE